MRENISARLVCRHGTVLESCLICQAAPSPAYNDVRANLDRLFRMARPRLLHLARLNGIADEGIEDVVQETLAEAWRQLEKLRDPACFAAWLDGICRNICKRHRRAQAAERLEVDLPGSEHGDIAETFDPPDPQAIDPVEELERQDMQMLLDRALGHLSASTRELIELCYLAELPQREVAQRLDMSLGALELKLHRARRQLRLVLNGALRADAQACGLLLDEEEALSWQETRQWCWLCGKQRLRGTFERQPSGIMALRLRCPDCSSRYDVDITYTGDWPVIGSMRSFRPAIKRTLLAAVDFYSIVLSQRRCSVCQASVQIYTIDRNTLETLHNPYDSLPQGIYTRTECPNCGTFLSEFISVLLINPLVRAFLLDRSRVLSIPNTRDTYAGQGVIRSRLLDLSNGETLTIMTHPESLHVIATMLE